MCSARYAYPIGKSNLVNDEPKRLVGDYLGQIVIRFEYRSSEVSSDKTFEILSIWIKHGILDFIAP